MKEIVSEQPHQSTVVQSSPISTQHNSIQARRIRIDKNRAIRKNKTNIHQNYNDAPVLSREQKIQMQKVKNREAAQKSREQKKQYLQFLENQVKNLKNQLASKQLYCHRCKSQITTPETNLRQQMFDQQFFHQNDEEESLFRRIQNSQHSQMGLYLFITMAIIAVVCFNIPIQGVTHSADTPISRDLMAIQQNKQIILKTQQIQFKNTKDKQDKPNNGLVKNIHQQIGQYVGLNDQNNQEKYGIIPFQNGIVKRDPLNNSPCLKQIIEKHHILSDNNILHLRNSQERKNQKQHNLLFCQIPRIYRGNNQRSIFSNFLDIVVSGSQMLEIVEDKDNYKMKQIIDVDTIYQLKAQIKQIIKLDKYSNCLI